MGIYGLTPGTVSPMGRRIYAVNLRYLIGRQLPSRLPAQSPHVGHSLAQRS